MWHKWPNDEALQKSKILQMASSHDHEKCIMWCCYNSYIIEGNFRPHKPTGKRLRTFYDFLDEVYISLIGEFRSVSIIRQRSVTKVIEPRLQNVGSHHPERPADATGNQTCAVCREKANRFAAANPGTVAKDNPFKKAKTVFRCSSCLTFLCIREGSNCWMDFQYSTGDEIVIVCL